MRLFPALLIFLISLTACKEDDPAPEIERQEITNLRLLLMSSGMAEPIMLTYEDLDGPGGDPPVIEGGSIAANTIYFGSLEVENQNTQPAENIVTQIQQNPIEYQVFYRALGLDIEFIYADQDGNGFPLGLFVAVNSGTAGSGEVNISLVRSPNKAAMGVEDGIIDNAGGQIQVQATFPLEIK